jgi:hypothetical protein
MEIIETKTKILKLNNPQFGSFGEYVFSDYVVNTLKKKLSNLHRDHGHYIFEGNIIDVGSHTRCNLYHYC